MRSLTEEQLEFLNRYDFDILLWENWRKGVKERWYSKENNCLEGEILVPESGSIHGLPRRDDPEYNVLESIGMRSLERNELGVVILNGGMATRFGGVVKGGVKVLGKRSFLALKMQDVRQMQEACGQRIPVYLMNSFATDEATREHFKEHDNFGLDAEQIHHFTQFISVRMQKDGDLFLTPAGDISPYGPGHGDFAAAFRQHGLLKQFLACGRKYLFISNVDNLGARISPLVLGHHIQKRAQATVELAPKWPDDTGGSPYLLDGKLQLVEQIRYPKGFDPDIVDVFNTNTFHFDASALDQDFDLNWYFVEKEVEGQKTVQMERLIGELTRHLETSFLRIKRTGLDNRFLPVKTPEDLKACQEEIAALYPDSKGSNSKGSNS